MLLSALCNTHSHQRKPDYVPGNAVSVGRPWRFEATTGRDARGRRITQLSLELSGSSPRIPD